MGLFDFFKKKENNDEQKISNSQQNKTSEKYLGDLNKTQIIRGLCEVPKINRDDKWKQVFFKNISNASFRCGSPQVIKGPDENLYFNLLLPEPNKEFECFVVNNMISDYLLSDGLGIAINADKEEPDWVFSYGDIVDFYLNKQFYSNKITNPFTGTVTDIMLHNNRLRIGHPSETYLPQDARKVIRDYLASWGLDIKFCLMLWIDKDNKLTLTFNILPTMFKKPDLESVNTFLHFFSWYFPRHYKLVCMEENDFFQPI